MKKLHLSFLHKLDNSEFRILYANLLRYMKNREFEDPAFTVLLKGMQSHKADVANLIDKIEIYKETKKINKLTRQRTDYFISLRLEIKAKMLSYIPEMREPAQRLYTWLNYFKKTPYSQSIIAQKSIIDTMLHDRDSDAQVREDISLLNLDGLLDAIDEITKQIEINVKLRVDEKGTRIKKGIEIRNAAYEELKTLSNYIESQLRLVEGDKTESEYYQIILDIHPKLKDAHTLLKSRITRNINKKRKAALKQLLISKQTKEELSTSQQDPAKRDLPMVIIPPLKQKESKHTLTDKPVKSNENKPSKDNFSKN